MISSVLVYTRGDADAAAQYANRLANRFPKLSIITATTAEQAAAVLPNADALLAFGSHMPRGILEGATRLKWIHALGTGVDGIVDQPFLRDDVIVTSTRGIHGAPMSELAILLMLSLARDFPRTVRAQDRASWERWRMQLLAGKTVGIAGTGLIAAALAPRCKAMAMRVIGISRSPREMPGFDDMVALADLAAKAHELDFLVLLIPYSADTHHIVNDAVLGAMKPGSYLVNLARGGVLDEDALLRALRTGTLAGAALDVMQQEPLPVDHPLWHTAHLIITPHIGGYYDAYIDDATEQICRNLQRLQAGQVHELENLAR
jgi:D-2-hydroxyacid dehydrogenase (NADP+)